MYMETISQRQWDCLKKWAETCQDCFRRSGHMPPLTKIPAENGGFTLSGTPSTNVCKDEVDAWNNFLDDLRCNGIIQDDEYHGNLTIYRFTSIAAAEQILAL